MADDSNGRNKNRSGRNVVVLGPKDSLVGTLHIEGDLVVHGNAEGEVVVSGDVTVEAGATVQASVDARSASVRGSVTGNLVIERRLQVSGSGTVTGEARVGRLVVEDGGTLNGSITMSGIGESGSALDASDTVEFESELVAAGDSTQN